MVGSSSEDYEVSRSLEGLSNGQQWSGEALAEWWSSEQVENGITSTSPPYRDTDDDDCGCDFCNHLSLFLCVSNSDKLIPEWSHFAQFTISFVIKDPKKPKYSDTLHRFWKKEYD